MIRPPLKYVLAALWQWFIVGLVYGVCVLLTYFPIGFIIAYTAEAAKSPFGEGLTKHDDKYIAQGSSGIWEYWASPIKWLKNWNNYEDGLLGESSGKHSARVHGQERTFWAIYQWLCRNPFNWGKRTSRFFACYVNDCTIDWWGTGDVSDKAPIKDGWYFVRAVDKTTGRSYYGYRYVVANDRNKGFRLTLAKLSIAISNLFTKEKKSLEGTVYNAVFGFKIKPSHAKETQDDDDLDKAFTARVQFASTPD